MFNYPFQKDLLTKLPDDVWLDWKLKHPDNVNAVFLDKDNPTYGCLLGYIEVEEISQEIDCIRMDYRLFMPIREDDTVPRAFVTNFKGDQYDYVWFKPYSVNSHTKAIKQVFLDQYDDLRLIY